MLGFHILVIRFLCSNAITQHRATYRPTRKCLPSVDLLVVRLFGCLLGWFVGWMDGWLVGWLVGLPLSSAQSGGRSFFQNHCTQRKVVRCHLSEGPTYRQFQPTYITNISQKYQTTVEEEGTIISSIAKSLKVSKAEDL